MTFTDDDLKRFKFIMALDVPVQLTVDQMRLMLALLSRLEAAEVYAEKMASRYASAAFPEYVQWRKAAGKS